jgi:hypothetical protein
LARLVGLWLLTGYGIMNGVIDSELEVITVPLRIFTLYKSAQHSLRLFQPAVFISHSLAVAFNSEDSSGSCEHDNEPSGSINWKFLSSWATSSFSRSAQLHGHANMFQEHRKKYILMFWIVAPCSLIDVYDVFGGTYNLSLQHQMAAMGAKLWKVSNRLPDHTVSQLWLLVQSYRRNILPSISRKRLKTNFPPNRGIYIPHCTES